MKKLFVLFICFSPSIVFGAGYCGNWGKNGTAPWTVSSTSGGTASVARDDVNACVNTHAAAGDTINLPAATANWTSDVTITKAVKILGVGGTSTTINRLAGQLATFFTVSPTSDVEIRVSGINFTCADLWQSGYRSAFSINSTSSILRNIRIDNNRFVNGGPAIWLDDYTWILIDSNTFINVSTTIYLSGSGSADAWNYPIGIGTINAPFIEDNTFTQTVAAGCNSDAVIYQQAGTRVVIRNNTFTFVADDQHVAVTNDHGNYPEVGRGVVFTEAYGNTISASQGSGSMFGSRGGTQIIHDNAYTCSGSCTDNYKFQDEEAMGTSYFSAPIASWPANDQVNNSHIWNNTINGVSNNTVYVPSQSAFLVQKNRDFFEAAPAASGQGYEKWGTVLPTDTGAKGGANNDPPTNSNMSFVSGASIWNPYTPYGTHPLRGSGDVTGFRGVILK